MRRPGPLQELPLHIFTTETPSNSSKPAIKRPHSPHAGDLLLSPSKRRILGEEGFLAKSGSPQRHSGYLNASSGYTPRKTRSTTLQTELGKLPYPYPYDSPNPSSRHDTSIHNATVLRSQTPSSPHTRRVSRRSEASMNDGHCTGRETVEVVIARRNVSSPDRQSIHYPGFDIHYDEYTVVPPADAQNTQSNTVTNPDGSKENVAPKRRTKRAQADALSKEPSPVKSISRQKSRYGWDETRDDQEDIFKTPTQKLIRMGESAFLQMLNSPSTSMPGSPTLRSSTRRRRTSNGEIC